MSLINVSNLTFGYDGAFDNVFENVSFQIDTDWRLGFVGRNGRGKTTFFKLLMNEFEYSGKISSNVNFIISYVPQSTDGLCGSISDLAYEKGIDESLFRTVLSKLDFSREQLEKNIEHFSEGQKKKVLLAESLCTPAHLYVWDEPLNYIDVISRIQLENLLKKFSLTIIFVEHDKTFSDSIATKIIEI